ncbi:T9SS type A sorting domain-containing protein [Ulvibacter antarcticus]|uniref:Putative secreted protein (Por secretion system target) n=1 Tax=Ulvibacter antarcticus TaxID=442714 RepID=A0A3L9Z004_9FLAO|nr:T9SS type A sorting domain-containing protein [Ulvibacter antarcticus]RMA66291.1 putative secreted protein (Por secretion system target) [Ulvibacter antarcticus]
MKKQLSFLLLLLSVSLSYSQNLNILSQNTIGGSDDDRLYCMDKTTDGGSILGGRSTSNISGDKTENAIGNGDYWVVKLDSNDTIEWQHTIGGTFDDHLYSIKQTLDGGYILGGISNSNISGDKTEDAMGESDYWIVKIDASGVIEWENTIGGTSRELLYSVVQSPDNGYFIGGSSDSNISGDKSENRIGPNHAMDYWVVKLDANGIIEWDNTIGGDNEDSLYSVVSTDDGGCILGGHSSSNISGDKAENSMGEKDYWAVKLNSGGDIAWQNTIGGSDSDIVHCISQTTDGGYIFGGTSWSDISGDKTENAIGDGDIWVVKIDSFGQIQWENTIGGNGLDFLESIIQTMDGGYILASGSDSNISGDKTENSEGLSDYWVVKLNSEGIIEGQSTVGGNGGEAAYSIIQSNNGSYVVAGFSDSNISGDKTEDAIGLYDYWVVRLDGNLGVVDNIFEPNISLYPNPTTDVLNIASDELSVSEIKIYDSKGSLIKKLSNSNINKTIDVSKFASGIYYVQISSEEKIMTKMFVKQ